MTKHDLNFPISVNGSTISSVTISRPKGADMVAIGDDVAHLMRFYSSNAKVVQEITDAQAVEKLTGVKADLEVIGAKISPPDSKVYQAMISIAAQLAGLGEAAGELDVEDLQEIAAKALNTGEAPGRGAAKTGDE